MKAGLFRIEVGIESGSELIGREIYDRHVSNEVVIHATHTISAYPLVLPTYLFIIANPCEEGEDLTATARLTSGLPYGSQIVIYNLVFFPGSALNEQAIRDRFIEGVRDCGYELDYLGGLHYKQHSWKRKNLYLNGLTFLMAGCCTRRRVGVLPRLLINALLGAHQIEFIENQASAIRVMFSTEFFLNLVRYLAARRLKKIIGNPVVVYNLKLSLTA